MTIEYNNREILSNNQFTHIDQPIAVSSTGGKVTWADMIDFGNASLGTNYSIDGTWNSVLSLIQSLIGRIKALENGQQVVPHSVSFVDGTSVTTRTVNEGDPIGTLPFPTKTGYTFNGWFDSQTGGTRISENTIITADITYYAQWAINTYTVSLNVTNGAKTPNSAQTVNYGESVSWTVTPVSGYELPTTVSGAVISGNTVTISSVTSNKTIEITCTQVSTYTVTLNVTNGSITSGASSQTVSRGGSVSWTVTPASGYEMPTSVNGATISGNTVTVSNVTSNKTISLTCTQPAVQYYFYVGTSKPTSLSQTSTVTSYPAEQTYTNNSGAKSHIFVLTNNGKIVEFINLELNAPVSQNDVDTTTIPGYKIFETAVGLANTASIKIRIS